MTLYELTEQFKALMELADNEDVPEDVFVDTLEALEGEIEEKVDGLCSVIKTFDAESAACKAEADRLTERAKKKAARRDKMKDYLSNMMQKVGMSAFDNPRHAVKFNKGEKVIFTDEPAVIAYLEEHYPELVTVKTTTSADKTGIKKMIKGGVEIPFAATEITMSISVK